MPKRTDIKKILVIGSGPIVIVRLASLTILARKHAAPFAKRALRLFWLIQTQQPS